MIETDDLPHRPLTDSEFEEFVAARDVECPLAFHSYCTHCDTEGVVSALVRDGRTVYSLNHGRDEWELKTLEQDMAPEMFRMIVSQLDDNPGLLREVTGGAHLEDIEEYPVGDVDVAANMDDFDIDLELLPDTSGTELPEGPPLRELVDEETRERIDEQLQEILDDRIDSLDSEEIERLFEREADPTQEDLETLLTPDVMQELNDVIDREISDELLQQLGDELDVEFDDEFPMMLDVDAEDRFLDLYAHLLCYVNDQFDVVSEVETSEDIAQLDTGTLLPLREKLYETDTESLIEAFIEDNPASLSEDDLDVVGSWTDYLYGDFVVVRHLENYAVFLDLDDPPRAFGVKSVRMPFTDLWPEQRLPVFVSQVALLPFEDQIVTDGWLAIQRLIAGPNMSTDIDDAYEEAKHRFNIIESLPAPDQTDQSDAEQLRFYLKNKRNRERYAEEIDELKDKNEAMEQIYHQEMGKARARSLGRELRETDLEEAYFAIYDDRIIASGTSEEQVRNVLSEILPDGKETHPYIYHYDP